MYLRKNEKFVVLCAPKWSDSPLTPCMERERGMHLLHPAHSWRNLWQSLFLFICAIFNSCSVKSFSYLFVQYSTLFSKSLYTTHAIARNSHSSPFQLSCDVRLHPGGGKETKKKVGKCLLLFMYTLGRTSCVRGVSALIVHLKCSNHPPKKSNL